MSTPSSFCLAGNTNQVWAVDITYIPYKKGFMYLVAIMDWNSRKVLSWRTSNTMTVDFCVSALNEALALYRTPEIFNSDYAEVFTKPRNRSSACVGMAG